MSRRTYVPTVAPEEELAIAFCHPKRDEIDRLVRWPEGSSRICWWYWPDGSWTAHSTSVIVGGPHHGKWLFQAWANGKRAGMKEVRRVYCSSLRTAKGKALKFGKQHS